MTDTHYLDDDTAVDENDKINLSSFTDKSSSNKLTCNNALKNKNDVHKIANEIYRETYENLETTKSGKLLKQIVSAEGVGDHHIMIFDHWVQNLLGLNISRQEITLYDGSIVRYENVQVHEPSYQRGMQPVDLTPKYAREQGVTFGVNIYTNLVKITKTVDKKGNIVENKNYYTNEKGEKVSVFIGNIPLMLKSIYCPLRGKSKEELVMYGEDPNDPGGYFIVEGNEKVVLGQEQLITDKILLMNLNNYVSSKLTANTPGGTVVMEIYQNTKNYDALEIFLPKMKPPKSGENKSLNILRIFRIFANWEKANGRTNEISILDKAENIKKFIATFIKNDPEIRKKSLLKLNRTLLEFEYVDDDYKIISKHLGKLNDELVTDEEILEIFDYNLFPHLNRLIPIDGETEEEYEKRIILAKLNLLAIMTARLLEYLAGFRKLDDRDSWSNKRVEGAGRLMEKLLLASWKKTNETIQKSLSESKRKDLIDVASEIIKDPFVSCTFRDSFITGKWGLKGTKLKDAVAQPLNRDGVVATLAHINTVDVSISRTDRQHILRLVQMSQFGFISHISSSEGKNCGLLKNFSITTKLSIGRDDTDIIRHLIGDENARMKRKVALTSEEAIEKGWNDKIIVASKFIGWCNGEEIKNDLIQRRRQGEFCYDMSVVKEDDFVYVDVSPSRVIRPLLLVNPESQKPNSQNEKFLMIDVKNKRGASNYELIVEGCMEYVSAWEQEYIKLAVVEERNTERLEAIYTAALALNQELLLRQKVELSEAKEAYSKEKALVNLEEAQNRVKQTLDAYNKAKDSRSYTHCEIDPLALVDISAALIPWPNHNQAPRNTYQVAMGKQALGVYHDNHINRMNDGATKVLMSTQRPLVETDLYGVTGLDKKGPGENVLQQFSSIPYTEEDAFVVKKEFLDNGGLRYFKYITYKMILNDSNSNWVETLKKPTLSSEFAQKKGDKYKYMGDNGLPKIWSPVKEGDYIIGKVNRSKTEKDKKGNPIEKNESVVVRVGDEGVITKVLVSSNNRRTMVIVKIRTLRIPQVGDKYAPRNAQKATIGLILSDIDLQYGLTGLSADFTANSSCFTSDTPVAMKNGLSKPLTSMLYDGGDKVLSWDKEQNKMLFGTSAGYELKGVRDTVKLTFSDGRTVKCTPDHRFPVMEIIDGVKTYKSVHADKITNDMFVLAGYDCVLDEIGEDEVGWELPNEHLEINMKTSENREKSLAFMRLLGYLCADGSLYYGKGYVLGSLVVGSKIDLDMILDDIKLTTGKTPAWTYNEKEGYGNTFDFKLPHKLSRAMGLVEGMTIGRRSMQKPEWPKFLFQNNCPKSIIREFLGGLFGGDGWCPYLKTNKQDGDGTVTFNPPAISMSSLPENGKLLSEKMTDIGKLLEKFGIRDSRTENLKPYEHKYEDGTIKKMVRCCLQLQRGTEFGDKIGFRYCVQKMFRQAGYQSYMRYLENVKRQNDTIIRRASEIYDNGEVKRSLQKALDKSRLELYENEKPLNEYYSNATLDQLRNRRRKDRHDELKKWDYKFIEDADKYLRKIDAYHWYRTEEGTGGADYIVSQHDTHMPNFYLKLHDIRTIGKEEVFDFGVQKTHYLVVNGVVALNCLPSRMTMAYSMEQHSAKAAAMGGTRVNCGAHHVYERDKHRNTLKKYGMNEFAYEEMRSGTSGNYLEALIACGPVYFQALKHHVKDKIQSRGVGTFNPQTRQPLRGRTNHGGLRWLIKQVSVENKISASQYCSWRHNQIQGTSCLIN